MSDDEDFAAFVAARHHALLRTAFLLTADRPLAEDLVQTALTKTYIAWGRIRDRQAVEAYVRRTMMTTYVSWWRRHRDRERSVPDTPEGFDGTTRAATDAVADRAMLWPHLAALPRGQRAAVVLRFYEDLSEAETARLLGCSVGTVKSQTSRALATLRQRLQDSGELTATRAPSTARPPSTALPSTPLPSTPRAGVGSRAGAP